MLKYLFPLFFLVACTTKVNQLDKQKTSNQNLTLTLAQAERLSGLPLKCIQQEYPNKLGQVLNDSADLHSPKTLHPAFYGCFDWHSSVHGHWLMVRLLKQYHHLKNNKLIRQRLNQQLTKENILTETAFFKTKLNGSFERTYGWSWILKLHQELLSWEDKDGKIWAQNLQPLADYLVDKYIEFLPKLHYPIRTGDHINLAFGLTMAYDYAVFTKNDIFKNSITKRSKEFYLKDVHSPLAYEPNGYDFLSPSMEEVDLMRRVLPKSEFILWFEKFLPEMLNPNFDWEVGVVSDRSDGKLVHLDGLNFSRAWCLYNLGHYDVRYHHLIKLADKHLAYSLPSIVDGDYMGEHWLATFALTAFLARENVQVLAD